MSLEILRLVKPTVDRRQIEESIHSIDSVREEVKEVTKAFEDFVMHKYIQCLVESAADLANAKTVETVELRLKEMDGKVKLTLGEFEGNIGLQLAAISGSLEKIVAKLAEPSANESLEHEVLEKMRSKLQ